MDKNTKKNINIESLGEENDAILKQSFQNLKQFFYMLALFSFISALFLVPIRSNIYSEHYQTGNILKDILFNRFIECAWKALTMIPIIILIYNYKKKIYIPIHKTLFSIIAFLYVTCGMIIPFVATAMSSSYEIADMLMIFSGAFCMFFIGETANKKKLKIYACIIVGLPLLLLGAYSTIDIYYQYSNSIGFSAQTVYIFGLIKSLCHIIIPTLCYLTIALQFKQLLIEE